MERFYLGIHHPEWLERLSVRAFVSHRRLVERRSLPRAGAPWALDSGGFTEIREHGRWTLSAAAYVQHVRRYRDVIGNLEWAAIQDWMCERDALVATGLTVEEHQRRTVDSYLELEALAPELPWTPVLQGWCPADYEEHVEMYADAGVDLATLPLVGVGSVCRRGWRGMGAFRIAFELSWLAERHGLRLHAFGLSLDAFKHHVGVVPALVSSDSMAWSFGARRRGRPGDRNSLSYALGWRQDVVDAIETASPGLHLPSQAVPHERKSNQLCLGLS